MSINKNKNEFIPNRSAKYGWIVSSEYKQPILEILNENNRLSIEELYSKLENDYFGNFFNEIDLEREQDNKGRVDTRWKKNVRNAMRTMSENVEAVPSERKYIKYDADNKKWFLTGKGKEYISKEKQEFEPKIYNANEFMKDTGFQQETRIEFWICPKESCEHKKIILKRNENNNIGVSTYKQVIIHFLQHLKKNNIYFGSTDCYKIFLDNISENVLSDEDKGYYPSYGRSKELIWRTQLKATLDGIKRMGYIETNNINKIPKKYNLGISDKRKYRTRKRTNKFFEDFESYNDWELYCDEEQIPMTINDVYEYDLDDNLFPDVKTILEKEIIKKIREKSFNVEKLENYLLKLDKNNEEIGIIYKKYWKIILEFLTNWIDNVNIKEKFLTLLQNRFEIIHESKNLYKIKGRNIKFIFRTNKMTPATLNYWNKIDEAEEIYNLIWILGHPMCNIILSNKDIEKFFTEDNLTILKNDSRRYDLRVVPYNEKLSIKIGKKPPRFNGLKFINNFKILGIDFDFNIPSSDLVKIQYLVKILLNKIPKKFKKKKVLEKKLEGDGKKNIITTPLEKNFNKILNNRCFILILKEFRFGAKNYQELLKSLIPYNVNNVISSIQELLYLNLISETFEIIDKKEKKQKIYYLTEKGRIIFESFIILNDLLSGKITEQNYISSLKHLIILSDYLNFENIWYELVNMINLPLTLYSLITHKPNEIIAINDYGLVVKTENVPKNISKIEIRKAWCHFISDGILFQKDYEKASYRSSFILMLFSHIKFVKVNRKPQLSIELDIKELIEWISLKREFEYKLNFPIEVMKDWICTKINQVQNKNQHQIESEIPSNYINGLIIFGNSHFHIKKSILCLIPEITSYLRILNSDQKRVFFKKQEYRWRRNYSILNLDNFNKKEIFFNKLKKESIEFDYKKINCDLIFDLNNNKIFFNEESDYLNTILGIPFENYKTFAIPKDKLINQLSYYSS